MPKIRESFRTKSQALLADKPLSTASELANLLVTREKVHSSQGEFGGVETTFLGESLALLTLGHIDKETFLALYSSKQSQQDLINAIASRDLYTGLETAVTLISRKSIKPDSIIGLSKEPKDPGALLVTARKRLKTEKRGEAIIPLNPDQAISIISTDLEEFQKQDDGTVSLDGLCEEIFKTTSTMARPVDLLLNPPYPDEINLLTATGSSSEFADQLRKIIIGKGSAENKLYRLNQLTALVVAEKNLKNSLWQNRREGEKQDRKHPYWESLETYAAHFLHQLEGHYKDQKPTPEQWVKYYKSVNDQLYKHRLANDPRTEVRYPNSQRGWLDPVPSYAYLVACLIFGRERKLLQ